MTVTIDGATLAIPDVVRVARPGPDGCAAAALDPAARERIVRPNGRVIYRTVRRCG